MEDVVDDLPYADVPETGVAIHADVQINHRITILVMLLGIKMIFDAPRLWWFEYVAATRNGAADERWRCHNA
jgi:hypothetical protein